MILVITGTSGSGKSTVVKRLCEIDSRFATVRAVTTRQPRPDDIPGQYEYLSLNAFDRLTEENELSVSASYRSDRYGIRRTDLLATMRGGGIAVLVITPESAVKFQASSGSDVLSIFLDHERVSDRLDARDNRTSQAESAVLEQRSTDRKHADTMSYIVQNHSVNDTVELIRLLCAANGRGGVLPKRWISLMVRCGMLLTNVEDRPDSYQPASYDLSLGDEYFYGGKLHRLSDHEPILVVAPYDYAIVTSREFANLPKDVCGRFDLSVSLFCQGVILSNGPQVDPGFRGPLFCLLFNTSSSPVLLKRGQHYATLEFHRLIEATESYTGQYQKKTLLHYLPTNAARGAINELKMEIERLRSDHRLVIGTAMTILGLILAGVAVVVTTR